MRGGQHFEASAESYDRARPPYPDALWARLRASGHLAPGLRVLELGAGSGLATAPLLAAGLEVTAVEPGPRLAAVLRRRCPGADVVVARAEEVAVAEASVERVVCATSVHWLDLDVVLPRVRRWLTAEGRLLVWRHVFGSSVRTPFRDRVAAIVADRRRPPRPGPDAQDRDVTAAQLTRSGLFEVEEADAVGWSVELDEEQVRLLFGTFSDWTPDEVARAASAVRELGGRVRESYGCWLLVLRPRRDVTSG